MKSDTLIHGPVMICEARRSLTELGHPKNDTCDTGFSGEAPPMEGHSVQFVFNAARQFKKAT